MCWTTFHGAAERLAGSASHRVVAGASIDHGLDTPPVESDPDRIPFDSPCYGKLYAEYITIFAASIRPAPA
jgi:hypothetical protein